MTYSQSDIFETVCSMEDTLAATRDLVTAIAFMTSVLNEPECSVLERVAWIAKDQCEKSIALREKLFELTHPSPAIVRARMETER